ncbi:MAG: hypothetical protein AAGD14_17765 [Planctomycetota bacterium]
MPSIGNESCIWASGERFDAAKFVDESGLDVDYCWHQGEVSPDWDATKLPPHSGFGVSLETSAHHTYEQQFARAVAILQSSRDAFCRLREMEGVCAHALFLIGRAELDPGVLAFSVHPPAVLLALLVDLDVQLEFYFSRERRIRVEGSS